MAVATTMGLLEEKMVLWKAAVAILVENEGWIVGSVSAPNNVRAVAGYRGSI